MTSRKDNSVQMQVVENSSTISSIGYDDFMGNLRIQFKNGTLYEYVGVPKKEFDELVKAESVGKHFASSIKSKYDFMRLL